MSERTANIACTVALFTVVLLAICFLLCPASPVNPFARHGCDGDCCPCSCPPACEDGKCVPCPCPERNKPPDCPCCPKE